MYIYISYMPNNEEMYTGSGLLTLKINNNYIKS